MGFWVKILVIMIINQVVVVDIDVSVYIVRMNKVFIKAIVDVVVVCF